MLIRLVQLLEGTTKAVFAHTMLSSRWFQSTIVFEKNEFFLMSVLHWTSSKNLELFTVCRSIIFDASNPSHCLAFLFLLLDNLCAIYIVYNVFEFEDSCRLLTSFATNSINCDFFFWI